MEQNEITPNQLISPNGAYTKRLLEKKNIQEPKYLRMIKARTGTWIGTNEPFESEERDQEIANKWQNKINKFAKLY